MEKNSSYTILYIFILPNILIYLDSVFNVKEHYISYKKLKHKVCGFLWKRTDL